MSAALQTPPSISDSSGCSAQRNSSVFKIHLYIELTETCQCLKLSHHESFFSLFFFIWLPLAYNIIPHLLRLRKNNEE